MNCFLIDFENVRSSGLKGIERLINSDDVYIFYSDYANSITFDVHHRMNQSDAHIEFFKSSITGKNSLDFQLVSYLGYLIAQRKYKNYFVVTNDRGFESAISFWKAYFEQNSLTDLNINRYRSIQDALDKKTSRYSRPMGKTVPTIPTVESEIELQQLRGEKVIMDISSPQIEKHIEKNLHATETAKPDRKPSDSNNGTGTFKNKSSYYNQGSQKIVTNSNNFKSETSSVNTSKPEGENTIQDNRSRTNYRTNKNSTTQQSATPNANSTTTNRKTFNNPSTKKPTNTPNYTANNTNTNSNPNKKRPQNSTSPQQNPPKKPFAPNNELPKIAYKDTPKLPNKSNATQSTTKSKSFVFGKVNLNEDVQSVENFQSKNPTPPKPKNEPKPKLSTNLNLEDLKESIAVKTPSNEVKDTKTTKSKFEPKPVRDTKPSKPVEKPISQKAETTKPVEKPTSQKAETTKPVEKPTSQKAETTKPVEKPTTQKEDSPNVKRKVGRPRTRPLKDESEKPKNNKKFQGNIPSEKLNPMLERLSKIDELATRSNEDKVKICKIIAFSDSKQECYKTFMSCFGKSEGVKIYSLIKQQSDALRSLYLG